MTHPRARFAVLIFLSSLLAAAHAAADGPPHVDVLYVGDSHSVGVFGHTLDGLLREVPGTVVRTYASCGSSEGSWYSGWATKCGYLERVPDGHHGVSDVHVKRHATPILAKLLAAPAQEGYSRVTIVALGSNSVAAGEAAKPGIERMATDIRKSGSVCVWIGPPRMRRFGIKAVDRYYEVIADALHTPAGDLCTLIDSRKDTVYPPAGGDGIHYYFPGGPAIAAKWSESVFKQLEDFL